MSHPDPLPPRDLCATLDDFRYRPVAGVFSLRTRRTMSFRTLPGVSSCGRGEKTARGTDAGLAPRRGSPHVQRSHDVVDQALEQQLRLAFGPMYRTFR